jgi:hypothetical protein
MNLATITIVVTVVIALAVILLVRRAVRQRALPAGVASRLRSAMDSAMNQADPQRKVMDSAKILDGALKELGFQGSFADKLRSASPRLGDTQPVWNALKLRNKLAHEVGAQVSDRDAHSAAKAFSWALEKLM